VINSLKQLQKLKLVIMTKINQSPYGSMSGALGNLIGGTWKGKGFLRVRPASVHDANTPKQQAHRARFKACVSFTKVLRFDLVKPVWGKMAEGVTPNNLFVKTNLSVFNSEGGISDYGKLKISVGDLPLPKNIVVENSAAGNGAISISWSDNSGKDIAAATDKLRIVTVNGIEPEVLDGFNFTRQNRTATINLPYPAGTTVHVYLFFQNEAGEKYSDSFYALVNIPALPIT
jgi:hypothetical protein